MNMSLNLNMNPNKNLSMNLNQKLRNRTLDRRHKLRKVPDKFAFLQIERDDGGSVLDVSEGGLRFETFAPVIQNGPVHCWFSLNLRERIEAWGEVVWTDEERRYGGLRFLQLSEAGRAQIRDWICRPSPQLASNEEYRQHGLAMDRPARIAASEPDAVARFVAKARPRRLAALPGADVRDDSTLFAALQEVEASVELVPLQRYRSAKRRQLRLGLILGVCISATVAAAAVKYSRHENGGLGDAPAKLSVQKSSGEALKPALTNPSTPSDASADIFGSGKPKIHVAEVRTPSIPAAETGGHFSPRAWEATASNPPARAQVQPNLNGNASRQKPAMTSKQLWAAVQAGNTKAAVELADLYIKGQGVAQNCNQARVLLLVASEKRNAEAIKRLAELDKTDCQQN
jgi:hypothetical protein